MGAPLFKKATLCLENGNEVSIHAPENSDKNIYMDAMKVNGREYTRNYLTHGDLMEGASIEIKMSAVPNMQRGTEKNDLPYSYTNSEIKK